jgi:hypothetical protein
LWAVRGWGGYAIVANGFSADWRLLSGYNLMPTQLNVKDFGATGTATLDDSPAVQRAIDASESAPEK